MFGLWLSGGLRGVIRGFAIRAALGEAADVLLTGQNVVPARATEAGFTFRYPTLEAALRKILDRAA